MSFVHLYICSCKITLLNTPTVCSRSPSRMDDLGRFRRFVNVGLIYDV